LADFQDIYGGYRASGILSGKFFVFDFEAFQLQNCEKSKILSQK